MVHVSQYFRVRLVFSVQHKCLISWSYEEKISGLLAHCGGYIGWLLNFLVPEPDFTFDVPIFPWQVK
jgi:hypothetical protein